MAGQDRDKRDNDRGRSREGDRIRVVPPGPFGDVPEDVDIPTLGPAGAPVQWSVPSRREPGQERERVPREARAPRTRVARERVMLRLPRETAEEVNRVLASGVGIAPEDLLTGWIMERAAEEVALLPVAEDGSA